MVANDDLEGKTNHFTGFYNYTISGPNIPKTYSDFLPNESALINAL